MDKGKLFIVDVVERTSQRRLEGGMSFDILIGTTGSPVSSVRSKGGDFYLAASSPPVVHSG